MAQQLLIAVQREPFREQPDLPSGHSRRITERSDNDEIERINQNNQEQDREHVQYNLHHTIGGAVVFDFALAFFNYWRKNSHNGFPPSYHRLFSLIFLEIWLTMISRIKLMTVLNRLTAEEKLYWLLSRPILYT
ncbi:hypothetical protein D3C73_1380980 [compost metagenome]